MAENLHNPPAQDKVIRVKVCFYSYLKEMTGCAEATESVSNGSTLGELHSRLIDQYPQLRAMQKSTLMAVGVDYQPRDYVLQAGDEVSFFPPVQGG